MIYAFRLFDTEFTTVSRPKMFYTCIGDFNHIFTKVSSKYDSSFLKNYQKTSSRRYSLIYAFPLFDTDLITVSRPNSVYICIGDFNHIFAKVSLKYDSSFLKNYQKTSSRRYSLISAIPLFDTDLITVSRPKSFYIYIGDSLHISDKVSSNSDSYFSRIAKKQISPV